MNRFISLDVLRGITVVGMILVNNASGYSFLRHAPWNGCVLADFVFPFFLFIVGASLWFSSRKNEHTLNGKTALHIVKRGAIIFLIGFLLNWFPFDCSWDKVRILGVLQRIGLVYIFASFLCLWLKSYRKILIVCVSILLGYWALLSFTDSLSQANMVNNVIRKMDMFILGRPGFDPEGLLSTLPAICNAMFGYVFAQFLGSRELNISTLSKMALLGGGMILIALFWNTVLPFNKNLWTSSFALYTSGWAVLLWAPLAYIIDYKGKTTWSCFFRVFGANTLLAYILSMILAKLNNAFSLSIGDKDISFRGWLDQHIYTPLAEGTAIYPLLWAFTLILICWLVTYPLYRKKIYVRI